MQRAVPIAAMLALALLSACGSSRSDGAIRKTLERGVAEIREPQTAKRLHHDLVRTLVRLRSERPSTPAGRKAKVLAIQGFAWTLAGLDVWVEIARNDSGNVEATVRDAKRADRDRRKGAGFLRAAGRAVGLQIGELNGF
jgi:hypothetical protein